MPLKRKLSAFALWTLFACIVQLAVGHLSYLDIKSELSSTGSRVYDGVYDRTRINEILLQNFAALVASQPNNNRALQRFSSIIRERYPYVEQLYVHRLVNSENLPTVQAELALLGIDRFIVRAAGGDKHSIEVTSPPLTTDITYPIVFLSPLNAQTRYYIGLDTRSHPILGPPLTQSIRYPLPTASGLYWSDSNSRVFSLYQAVFSSKNVSIRTPSHVVALQINYSGLLPSSFVVNEHTTIVIRDNLQQIVFTQGDLESSGWLPDITRSYSLNRFGQTFEIQVSRSLSWKDINWVLIVFLMLFSAALFKASSAYHNQRITSLALKRQRLEELDKSRKDLEERVKVRTHQLNEQLNENRHLAHRILQIQEQERRFLARELHDELGQSLTAIRTDARILKDLNRDENSSIYTSAESIDAIALHIYNVTYDLMAYLRPSALDELGLTDAIHECASQLKLVKHNIKLTTDYAGALNEMSETYNITIYRLIQEAFNNIIRHAHASEVRITLKRFESCGDDVISLTINDNGLGMHGPKTSNSGGFGLIGMRERVIALGGEFQVMKPVDGGTRIKARFVINPDITKADEEKAKQPLAGWAELER